MSQKDRDIRDRIAENDVTMMRSYLEVDVADWFGSNQVPFGYEAFVVPSVVGPGKDRWDSVVEAVRNVGAGERDSIELPTGETIDAFDILNMWNDIYEKHKLSEERITIDPNPALERFSKRMLLPDFALYPDADVKTAGEDFNWGDYEYIVEVSGLYGVGLPEESTDDDWWDWYRVSAVAFKELAYKLLGLWDSVYWVIPNQPYIEGVTDGIPKPLRDDDHYIVMNTTQSGIQINRLADEIGVSMQPIEEGLSPAIQPVEYKRSLTRNGMGEINNITPLKYTFDGINLDNVSNNENTVILEDDYLLYHGSLGEVYIHSAHAHVRESAWRENNMLMLREYVMDVVSELDDDGIIENVERA